MDEVEKRMIQFQWKSSERLGMASILKPPIVSEVPTDVAIERDTGVPEPTKPVKPISPASIRAAESRELGETQDVQTASGETENTDPAIAAFERATEYLDSLSTVLDSYRRSYRPPIRRTTSRDTHNELEDVIDHVKELEDLEHSLGEVTRDGATIERDLEDNPPADDGEMAIIDEKLKELLPAESYTETKRQSELTHAEGQLINLLLSPSSVSEDAETYEITVNGETQEMGTPLQRVEELIERAPEVRDTYIRQLATPKTSDHEDCRELLVKMGVPVLQAEAPFEAEGLGASLVKAGLVDYVGTEDSDILAMSVSILFTIVSGYKLIVCVGTDASKPFCSITTTITYIRNEAPNPLKFITRIIPGFLHTPRHRCLSKNTKYRSRQCIQVNLQTRYHRNDTRFRT
jgi:flap endonuclease-1